METFKLDLSKLTPVAEDDRVKGNWYVVADYMGGYGLIHQWHSGDKDIDSLGGGTYSSWNFWFAIPPGLPGFPEAELPDEFELKASEYIVSAHFDWNQNVTHFTIKRKAVTLPAITIPSGTKSEQVAELKRLLEEFEK